MISPHSHGPAIVCAFQVVQLDQQLISLPFPALKLVLRAGELLVVLQEPLAGVEFPGLRVSYVEA